MPNKLFQGVFAGLPAAVANLPDMRPFVEERGVSKATDMTCPVSIIETVQNLYDDRASYRLAPNKFDDLVKLLSWEAQVDRLYDLYETLVTIGPQPHSSIT